MTTRAVYYIDEELNYIDEEVQLALSRSHDENIQLFCQTVVANYAMMNIDVLPTIRCSHFVSIPRQFEKGDVRRCVAALVLVAHYQNF